jgi:hypothetical protein
MKTMDKYFSGLVLALIVWCASGPAGADFSQIEPAAPSHQDDVAAFCKAYPNVDFPAPLFFGEIYKPGAIPQQIARLNPALR